MIPEAFKSGDRQ